MDHLPRTLVYYNQTILRILDNWRTCIYALVISFSISYHNTQCLFGISRSYRNINDHNRIVNLPILHQMLYPRKSLDQISHRLVFLKATSRPNNQRKCFSRLHSSLLLVYAYPVCLCLGFRLEIGTLLRTYTLDIFSPYRLAIIDHTECRQSVRITHKQRFLRSSYYSRYNIRQFKQFGSSLLYMCLFNKRTKIKFLLQSEGRKNHYPVQYIIRIYNILLRNLYLNYPKYRHFVISPILLVIFYFLFTTLLSLT